MTRGKARWREGRKEGGRTVEDSSGGSDDNVRSLSELGHVLSDVDSSDTGVTVDRHVVSEGDDDLLDLLGELSSRSKNQSLGRLDGGVDLREYVRSRVEGNCQHEVFVVAVTSWKGFRSR